MNAKDGMIFIDEIENGFHYSIHEIIWDVIFHTAIEYNVQIFATSHSIECVKAFCSFYSKFEKTKDEIRLYRIERKGDEHRVITYDNQLLETALDSEWEVR